MIVFVDRNFRPLAAESQALRPYAAAAAERYGNLPVLIDAERLIGAESIGAVLDRARINWMGTDGMRGETVQESHRGFAAFSALRKGILASEAVEYAAAACVKLLSRNALFAPGDPVCTANDGRDRAAKGRYDRAMKRGFLGAGARVTDLGIIPTPFVPHCTLSQGTVCGAMLTASHNPARQNGIKFFVNGKKLLPEGPLGEFALSALMWMEALAAESGRANETPPDTDRITTMDWNGRAKEFLSRAVNPADIEAIKSLLGDAPLVLDTANGACHRLAREWLSSAGISVLCVNPEPDGANINLRCGVARLEGTAVIEAPEDAPESPAAEALFRLGRAKGTDAWGLALDGDGDRGFLLRYVSGKDRVEVLDGDREGLLVLKAQEKRVDADETARFPGKSWAVFTIESDIMAAAAAECAGYRTATVGVGDRWLSSFTPPAGEGNLALGVESSGHLIIPCPIDASISLLSGNGLVTALRALAAAARLGETTVYESGFSKTWHVWEVDKNRFRRGSEVWNGDVAETDAALELWKTARENPEALSVFREDMGDPDLLYWSIREGGRLAAALFARNSGTEDKSAVYLKCRRDFAPSLLPLAEGLAARHAELLTRKKP